MRGAREGCTAFSFHSILHQEPCSLLTPVSTKLSRRKIVRKRHILTLFSSHFIKTLVIFRCIYYYYAKTKVESDFAIYFKTNIQIFFVLVNFFGHTPQFKMLVFAFQSEIWIAQIFNLTVLEDF